MGRKAVTEEALEALAAELTGEMDPKSTDMAETIRRYEAWKIPLNPVQREAFENRYAKYILMYGERGSGKTIGGLHMLVDHCFNGLNARGLVLVKESGVGKEGGAWDKLNEEVLPMWKKNVGLEYTDPRLDVETKKPYVLLRNRHGYSSRISFFSLPVDAHVEQKIHGREYTLILLDEAQYCESRAYFTHLIMQLGRRHHVDHQPIVYCANPDGPEHWLYKLFFIEAIDPETGKLDPDYAVYHVPISENIHNLPPGYYDRVIAACRDNPALYARMIRGEWVPMPTDRAIFADTWDDTRHIGGDRVHGIGMLPMKGYTAISGWDLGPVNASIHFMQFLPIGGKVLWLIFDEIDLVGRFMPYRKLVPLVVQRMKYWEDLIGAPFKWDHISDNAAFNQIRENGSFDAQEVERLSALSGCEIRMKPSPKGPASVPARVRMVEEMLQHDEILVSAACPQTIEMFRMGEPEKKGGLQMKRPFVHRFDSLSYPMFRHLHGGGVNLNQGRVQSVLIHCGRED